MYNKAIGPKQDGRSATIKVVESCVLLEIDQCFFQKVIMTIIKPELDEKINLLQSLSFMKKISIGNLISLAN